MRGLRARSFRLAVFVLSGLLLAPTWSLAQGSADDLFREGTEAFKAGRYETALSKFRAAESAGKRSSLLYYNLGVTHYKLQNYRLAEVSFERATDDTRFTALAYYNLGLTHKAQGDSVAARSWFEAAWEQTDDEALRQLAAKAIVSLNTSHKRRAANWRRPQQYDGRFDFHVVTQVGTDDNVFRTPNEDYIDLSDPAAPLVTPQPQSGEFTHIDVRARARYPSSSGRGTIYTFDFRGAGDYYFDAAQQNANEYLARVVFDAWMPVGNSPKSTKAFSNRFFAGLNKETNYDPDDGLERTFGGEDLSDRYTYSNFGIGTAFDQYFPKLGYGFAAEVELRDYQETQTVADYDFEEFLAAAHVDYEILPKTVFGVLGEYYVREYHERVARDLNGDLIVTNPLLEYRYAAAEALLKYRFKDIFRIRLSYRRTRRDDNFFGYADYTKDRARVVITLAPGDRFRADLAVSQREYEYDNAFAFNDPAGGPRELDGIEGVFVAQYRFADQWSIWAEVEYWDITSTDTRNQYERMRTMLGVKWEI